MNMNDRLTKFATIIIVSSMLFSGCISESDDGIENDSNEESENINDTSGIEPTTEDILEITGNDFCDLTNQIHCMLPFPSGFFLDDDAVSYTHLTLPTKA